MGNGGVCGFKSAVCERERSNLPGSHSFAPMAAAPTDSTQDAVDELRARPERTGMYFIVHRNTLLSAEYLDDPVEIAEEFFGRFTALNDQIQTLVKEFCAVKLDRELIRRQRERIRISSYRWDGVIRLGEGSALTYRIPTNFAWFLDWIKEREQLGWIDFIANIGVNVPVPEVLSYMGELYAYNVVIGEWQLGLRSLREAEQRGWIHQEMAYGTLDSDATDRLFTELRVLGEGLCSMDSKARELRCTARVDEAARSALTALMREGKAALGAYWDGVGPFARLLAARGYDAALAQDSPLRIFEDPDDGGGRFEGVTEQDYEQLFEARLGDLVSGVAFSHTEGLFRTDADRFEVLAPLMKTALNGSQLSSLHSPHDFLARFAPSILTAYLSRELTFEGDRDAACTSVARAVVERGGGDVDAATLLGGCWGAWLKQLSEQSEEVFHCEVLAQSTWVRGAQGEEGGGGGRGRGAECSRDRGGAAACAQTLPLSQGGQPVAVREHGGLVARGAPRGAAHPHPRQARPPRPARALPTRAATRALRRRAPRARGAARVRRGGVVAAGAGAPRRGGPCPARPRPLPLLS